MVYLVQTSRSGAGLWGHKVLGVECVVKWMVRGAQAAGELAWAVQTPSSMRSGLATLQAQANMSDLAPGRLVGACGSCAQMEAATNASLRLHPRPTNGILVAITVRNNTFASSGRLARSAASGYYWSPWNPSPKALRTSRWTAPWIRSAIGSAPPWRVGS